MSLNRLFRLISIALLMLFMAFAITLVWTQWQAYRSGARSVPALQHLRLALVAMEKLSAERGPANAYMGASSADSAALRERLQLARGTTDAALARLRAALEADPVLRQSGALERVKTVQDRLEPVRATVDAMGKAPAARVDNGVLSAVNSMVDLMPQMIRVVADLGGEVDRADPTLRDGLAALRAAASLREYAGQVGSRFVPPLIAHRKLTQEEVVEIGRLYGRIELLRTLLVTQTSEYSAKQVFAAALETVDRQYFDSGFQFLDYLLQVGLGSGEYNVSPEDLYKYYVPQMKSIIDLRDILLDDMTAQAQRHNTQARNILSLVVTLTVVACLFFQLLMFLIRRRVVQPLVQATDLVAGLVEGRLDQKIPEAPHHDEIGGMMRALRVLKHRMRERNSLAREREALITQLQASSNTDFLTGVMNRRAFFAHGQQQMSVALRYRRALSVILFDIDHFKRINDSYGHLAGDAILRGVAQKVADLLRKVDVLARYGGEEFILLLPESDPAQSANVAEKLRLALEQAEFGIDGGQSIRVTASFGVATLADEANLEGVIRLADQALYRAKKLGRNRVELAAPDRSADIEAS